MYELYNECRLCPRECGINRTAAKGACGENSRLYAAKAYLHKWEEPCICTKNGSGAVFFRGCSLRCVFCQNKKISRGQSGKEISAERLCGIFFELREKGACNINLITPTHFIPHIAAAVKTAKENGFDLPFVYNTSGYEKVSSLKLLDGLIDIYLTDFKYYSEIYARHYSGAPSYFKYAFPAVEEMFSQAELLYRDDELLKGVIVRILVLPGCAADSKRIIERLYKRFGNQIIYSIMSQYTPVGLPYGFSEIDRALSREEYESVAGFAEELGITNAYMQWDGADKESFIPDFDLEGI